MGTIRPLVSVIAVSFNHEAFVEQALNSVISQNYDNLELIIIDDDSDDNSQAVILKWLDEHNVPFRYEKLFHKNNIGLCRSLNEALSFSRGEFIQVLACDDILDKEKLSVQLESFSEQKDCALSCSNFRTIDKNGKILSEYYFPKNYDFPSDVFSAILHGHQGLPIVIHTPTTLIRKSALDEIGGYREDLIQEDFWMLLNMTNRYNTVFVGKPLMSYRILEGSLSSRLVSNSKRFEYLEEHLKVINDLLPHVGKKRREKLFEAKVQRLIKLANVRFSEASDIKDEVNIIFKKLDDIKNEVSTHFYGHFMARFYILIWRKGIKIQYIPFKVWWRFTMPYKIIFLLQLPYSRLTKVKRFIKLLSTENS